MKKVLLIAFTIILFNSSINAQATIEPVFDKTKLYLNILSPGFYVDQQVGSMQRLLLGVDIISLYTTIKDDDDDYAYYYSSFNPRIRAEFRNYYNRKSQKKELNNNSGNFFGLSSGYFFQSLLTDLPDGATFEYDNAFYAGPVWGMQRNYRNGFKLEFTIGVGYAAGKNVVNHFIPTGELNIGFVLK